MKIGQNRYLENENKNQGNDSNMLQQLLLLSLLGGGGLGLGMSGLGLKEFQKKGRSPLSPYEPNKLPHARIDSLLKRLEEKNGKYTFPINLPEASKRKIDSMLEMMKQKKFNLPEQSQRLKGSGMFGKLLEDRFPLPEQSEPLRDSGWGGKMLNPLFEKMQSLDLFDRMMNNLSNMID
jgi:hypothetical protein